METLLTVLITLMVVALTGAGINLVRLNRKSDELDSLKLETDLRRSDEQLHKDMLDRIDGWVASTDRRFDKTYNEIHKLNETVGVSKKSY